MWKGEAKALFIFWLGLSLLSFVGGAFVVSINAMRFSVRGANHRLTVVFHLAAEDAINLELTDTTWRWKECGCDSYAVEEGRLVRLGERIVLKAPFQKKGFRSPGTGIFYTAEDTPEVILVPSGDGSATVTGKTRGEPFLQTWEKGRVCAVCGGMLGPTSVRPCAEVEKDPCADLFGN